VQQLYLRHPLNSLTTPAEVHVLELYQRSSGQSEAFGGSQGRTGSAWSGRLALRRRFAFMRACKFVVHLEGGRE